MSNFSDWEFMLNGDTQEFRQKASEAGSFYFRIYGGVDHWLDCPNDDFRMTTIYSEGETDPNNVWQIGYELISLYNGASVLFNKNYRKASIFRLLYQEKQVNYSPQRNDYALLGKPLARQHHFNKELTNGAASCIKFALIQLATENQDVYSILKYLDREASSTTYYKLMEAVETFAKNKEIELDTTTKKRKIFTNTANNFSLSGFDSRHGFKETMKQNNTDSMSLDEGYEFVTSMTMDFLKKVYFSQNNTEYATSQRGGVCNPAETIM